mgnify:FL=1
MISTAANLLEKWIETHENAVMNRDNATNNCDIEFWSGQAEKCLEGMNHITETCKKIKNL